MIIADNQTAGRGRYQRHWYTIEGGLAISLILLSPPVDVQYIQLLSGLGAIAVCDALHKMSLLNAQIKWPNDVLVNQEKVAGVLVETRWEGDALQAAVIGIGINLSPGSINPMILPVRELDFPATSVETVLGQPVDRIDFLHSILVQLMGWLPRLATTEFIQHWQDCLAYQGQWVELSALSENQPTGHLDGYNMKCVGKVIGLSTDGSLNVQTGNGDVVTAQIGDLRVRPLNTANGQKINQEALPHV